MTCRHHSLNYLEFAALDLAKTQVFFEQVFGWQFSAYGAQYSAFVQAGEQSLSGSIEGGFYKVEQMPAQGAVLVVFYSNDLNATQTKIETAGGSITKPVFDFPGGQRFHFVDPNGNEFAVWSQS